MNRQPASPLVAQAGHHSAVIRPPLCLQHLCQQLQRTMKPENFPITRAQIEKLCDVIVDSIDKDAVCQLVSSHSGGLQCQVSSIDRGSYNISICLDFDGNIPKRLLRLPLRPAVRDCWTKVQSEAATLE